MIPRTRRLALLAALALALLAPPEARPAGPPRPRTDLHGDRLPKGALARLGTVRLRHGSWVSALTFSPDGRRVLSFSALPAVHHWDARTGRLERLARLP